MSSESESEVNIPPPTLPDQESSEELVCQRWTTMEKMFQALVEIVESKKLPENFMEVLSSSVGIAQHRRHGGDLSLLVDLQYHKLLYFYNEDDNKFTRSWTFEEIKNAHDAMKNLNMGWAVKNPTPQPRAPVFNIKPDEDLDMPKAKPRPKGNRLDINHSWEPLLGKSVGIIRSKDFLQVKAIIDKPKFSDVELHFMSKILPYIVQNIKMSGSACVQSKYLNDMLFSNVIESQSLSTSSQLSSANVPWTPFGNSSTTQTPKPSPLPRRRFQSKIDCNEVDVDRRIPASRLDLLVILMSVADPILAQDIFRLLGQFSLALPLIIPSIGPSALENVYTVAIPLLQTICVKRAKNGKLFENHLFQSPFKLVVAVRLGGTQNAPSGTTPGKSSILNHLMKDPYLFSCSQEKVSDRGKPFALHGSVEFTWLTIENCKGVLWDRLEHLFSENSNEILLLANLHGDAIDNPEIIQTLKSLACSFLVFQMPHEDVSRMETSFKTFQQMIGESILSHYLMVDSYILQSQMAIPEDSSIDTRNLNCMINLGKVASKLALCYTASQEQNKQPQPFKLDDIVLGEKIRMSQRVETTESQRIIDLIENISCSGIKDKLKLQKQVITDMKHYENAWRNDPTLQELIQMLVKILDLPLRQRQIAFAHLDKEISIRSGEDSRESRLLLCSLKEKRSKIAGGIRLGEDLMTNKELLEIDQVMAEAYRELERKNLGLEHFFREIGRIYEIAVHNPEDRFSSTVFNLASKVAELVIEGQVVELLDGDLGRISGAWLNAVSHEICKIKPGLKIFVISILGLQSTGKSTLLNALFGCKFSVSAGRCTRGLFMRLLFLDQEMKESTGIDAILLIDSEGLCAPEKMRDPLAEVRDKQMATFAMSVSHLTIINVKDEAMRDIAEILQIVVITLARLETIELAPDILLVQHGSECDSSKFLKATSEFCEALKEAIKVTDKQFTALGILNSSCLQYLCRRVDNHEILKLFHPYKSGASANAPPSLEYHEDVVDLYKKILTIMTNSSSSAVEFHKWHTLLNSCWNAVAVQNFALRFKNIQHIHEFIDRGARIANVNEAVERAFGYHRSLLKVYIQNQVSYSSNKGGSGSNKGIQSTMNKVEDRINDKLMEILHLCSTMTRNDPDRGDKKSSITQCDRCLVAITRISELETHIDGKDFAEDVLQTINSHIKRVREHTKEQLSEVLMEQFQQKYLAHDVDKVLHELIQQYAADGHNYNQSDGHDRALIVDTILDRLAQKLSSSGKVNPLASLREKMLNETLEVYKETPIADSRNQERLITGRVHPDHLRSVAAFPSDVSAKLTGVLQRGLVGGLKTKLNMKQSCWLENVLSKLPEGLSKKYEADGFQIGMIAQLQKDVDVLLDEVTERFGRLIETFKWEVHFYAIKGFYSHMELKHFQDSRKTRINALGDKADFYKKKIDACLSHGFSYASEGRILGECFLRALRQKAKKAGDGARKHELLHQSWLANSENVRLHFFETLATQVQTGNFANALEYFSNPKKSITSWFVNKVDSFKITLAKHQAKDNFNTEVAYVWNRILSSKSCDDVTDFAMEYFSEVDGIQYSNELDFSKASLKNFKQFYTTVLKTIEEKCQERFNSIVYKAASQHKTVMDRLGCTEFCYWCGALCWGHASHEQNKDSTQKHHTCHQPQGLIGVYDENTGKLIPNTCDSIQDDSVIRVKAGESKDKGLTWREIKMSKEFRNWIFINHAVDDFNNLMRWFFVKLNKEIASRAELLPCDEKDLKGLGLAHLDSKLDTIMTIIKQKLMS